MGLSAAFWYIILKSFQSKLSYQKEASKLIINPMQIGPQKSFEKVEKSLKICFVLSIVQT